jgi:hypothetical protein
MEQITLYLEKFKRFGFKNQILKEVVMSVVKDELGLILERGDIDLKDGVVRIKVSGAAKSELFIKKELIQKKVLEQIKDQGDISVS